MPKQIEVYLHVPVMIEGKNHLAGSFVEVDEELYEQALKPVRGLCEPGRVARHRVEGERRSALLLEGEKARQAAVEAGEDPDRAYEAWARRNARRLRALGFDAPHGSDPGSGEDPADRSEWKKADWIEHAVEVCGESGILSDDGAIEIEHAVSDATGIPSGTYAPGDLTIAHLRSLVEHLEAEA